MIKLVRQLPISTKLKNPSLGYPSRIYIAQKEKCMTTLKSIISSLIRRSFGKKQNFKENDRQAKILNQVNYKDERKRIIQSLKESDTNFPYPHNYPITHSIDQLVIELMPKIAKNDDFICLESISTAGRIVSIRSSSKTLFFIDLRSGNHKIQVMAHEEGFKSPTEFENLKTYIKRGDIVGFSGKLGLSKTGEFTLNANSAKLLAPCLHMLPDPHFGVTDIEVRYRSRHLDLITNSKTREIFILRSKIVKLIRDEFTRREFLEVETPSLNLIPGGANAKPFETYHNDLKQKMSLRISPELYLKACIVGGFERVFEIGKNFRNEQIDATHNPEFTSCEAYMAYTDINGMIQLSEEIISSIVYAVKGSHIIEAKSPSGEKIEISFERPFKRIHVVEELEKCLKSKLPSDFESPDANKFFDEQCKLFKIQCGEPRTTSRLIDKLIGHFIEPQCKNPTIILDHPQIMSPLAKYHRNFPGLSERFELFILQKEFVNSYSELNDPFIQARNFENQMREKAQGNQEACEIDESFINVLEYGLPPTGGWGLGIDRLVMLLADVQNIQEVILFPAIKNIVKKNT